MPIALLLAMPVAGLAAQLPTATVVSIGDNPASGQYFERISHVGIARDGSICVGDAGLLRIFCYSSDGKLQASIGGEGDGPGELRFLESMDADSVVTARDLISGRVTRYSLSGRVLGSEQVEANPFSPGVTRQLRNGSSVTMTVPRYAHSEWYDPWYRLILSRVGSASQDTIAQVRAGTAFWYEASDGAPYSVTSTPFGNGGAWTFGGDSTLVVADGYSGDVTWYAAGDSGLAVVRRTRVPVEVRPINDGDMAAVERSLREEKGPVVPREIVLRGPPSWSGITDLVLGELGDVLCIESPDGEGGSYWRALRADGSLDILPLPSGFTLKALRNNIYYGVVSDELGRQSVMGLRILVTH